VKAHTVKGALPYRNRFSFEAGDYLHIVTTPNNPGGPNEHERKWGLCLKQSWRIRVLQCSFEAVDLASPAISFYVNIKPAKRGLLRTIDLLRRQNQTGTGREHWMSCVYELIE
jgi:hypothetical protein